MRLGVSAPLALTAIEPLIAQLRSDHQRALARLDALPDAGAAALALAAAEAALLAAPTERQAGLLAQVSNTAQGVAGGAARDV